MVSCITDILQTDTGGLSLICWTSKSLVKYLNQVPESKYNINNITNLVTYMILCNAAVPDLTMDIGSGTAIYRASLLNPYYYASNPSEAMILFLILKTLKAYRDY